MAPWTLHGNLTPEAYEAWRVYAGRQGVTMSALLEAIGLRLRTTEMQRALADAVDDARLIADERRTRR